MANPTELPNPFTPLAFLPPTLATQFEVSRYLYAATLGAYIWDIGLNLGNDYALLFKYRIHFPTIVYFLSRIVTFAFILTSFIFQVAPVEDCSALALTLGHLCCFVADSHRDVVLFTAQSITAPLGVRAAHIGPTKQCITTSVPGNIEVAAIMPLVYDTAIFLAITYRILDNTAVADSPVRGPLRVFFGGAGLSALSHALLQSGQHFYLVAVAANLTLLIAVKLPQLSPVYHAVFTVPGLSLINAMACLVFRRIIFGRISADGTSKSRTTTGLDSDFHVTATPRRLPLHYRRTDATTTEFGTDTTTTFPLDIRAQEVDKFQDSVDASQEISKSTTLP
ncbi:hypothetical protein MSAN_02305800 [Mycena sanguinolenta]|uniref:Uncharacterized protein n=1 Tax=Mycena sanguinolenta TaxID=230812 RepID=A0A8H6X8G3_9AGAR|nr:hypothetical protein MSAN_02305800 [Mycena sanguinolenta]